jgi:hypothetical protein
MPVRVPHLIAGAFTPFANLIRTKAVSRVNWRTSRHAAFKPISGQLALQAGEIRAKNCPPVKYFSLSIDFRVILRATYCQVDALAHPI